jgi:hypothetical protein
MISPVGAPFFTDILHQNGIIRAELCALAAANTLVVGEHQFCHKQSADQ